MIRKLIYMLCILGFSLQLSAQNQGLFLEIISKAQQKDSLTLVNTISANTNNLKNDPNLAKALSETLDTLNCAYASFLIASYYPENTWSKYYQARHYAGIGNFTKAKALLENHLNSKNRYLRSTIRSCKDFSSMQNSNEWNDLWEKTYYTEQDFQFESVLNYVKNQKFNWALDEINQLLSVYPQNAKYLKTRAQIYLSLNQASTALRDIEKSIKIKSKDAEAHLIAAEIYTQLKRYSKAEKAIEKAEKINPYNIKWLETQIKVLSTCGNFEKVVEKAQTLTQYFKSTETLYLLADAQNHLGQYTDAIISMNKVLTEDTSQPKYFETRADAFKATKSWENAMKDYAMALDINPTLDEVYLKYGICRFESGDKDGACYLWKKALHYKNTEASNLIYQHCEK